jgi:hypothetical protein
LPHPHAYEAKLDTPEGLGTLYDAIVREKGVAKACKALGLDRKTVWLYLAKHPEAQAAASQARQETAHSLFDECCEIADNAKREDWAIARLRIETRMRIAGKLNQRTYGDQPRSLTQTYVQGDVQIVATEEQRRSMIDARQRFLMQRNPEIARHSLDAPSASPGVVRPQPKNQAGTPIGSTTAPEDPLVIHMRSFENGSSEDQAITR